MKIKKNLQSKLKKIKMLLMDVDGVLTDGTVIYLSNGQEMQVFNTHDGYGMKVARESNLILGIITGRKSKMAKKRAERFSFDEIHIGVEKKIEVYEKIKLKYNLNNNEIAFIGDDIPDLEVLNKVGFSASPKNAIREIKNCVDFVSNFDGGKGVVREIIDLILKHKNK